MIRRLTLLTGAAVGYVLGARAGRERYDQIVGMVRQARQNPEVQRATETVTETARATAQGEGPIADAASKAADKASSAVGSSSSGSSGPSGSTSPSAGVPTAGPAQDARSAVTADPPPPSSTAGDTAAPA